MTSTARGIFNSEISCKKKVLTKKNHNISSVFAINGRTLLTVCKISIVPKNHWKGKQLLHNPPHPNLSRRLMVFFYWVYPSVMFSVHALVNKYYNMNEQRRRTFQTSQVKKTVFVVFVFSKTKTRIKVHRIPFSDLLIRRIRTRSTIAHDTCGPWVVIDGTGLRARTRRRNGAKSSAVINQTLHAARVPCIYNNGYM